MLLARIFRSGQQQQVYTLASQACSPKILFVQPHFQSILILTGSFGHGHNTAAYNLETAFRNALGSESAVAVVDFFQDAYPWSNGLLRKGYGLAINQLPRLWQFIYGQADREGGPKLVPVKTFGRQLRRCFDKHQPTVVVSTFPIFPLLIEECYPDSAARPFSAATMITDAISINAIWCQGHSDLLFVTDNWSKEIVMKQGIPEERIRAHGFPLSSPIESSSLKELPSANPRILYLPTTTTGHVKATLAELLPWCQTHKASLTIVLGSHEKRLSFVVRTATDGLEKVTVYGWRKDVSKLMHEHHLTLTKAGGATVSETLGAQCPTLLNYVVPGQEEGNAELLKRSDCGRRINNSSELPTALSEILVNDQAAVWHRYRANLKAMNRAEASENIVRDILKL